MIPTRLWLLVPLALASAPASATEVVLSRVEARWETFCWDALSPSMARRSYVRRAGNEANQDVLLSISEKEPQSDVPRSPVFLWRNVAVVHYDLRSQAAEVWLAKSVAPSPHGLAIAVTHAEGLELRQAFAHAAKERARLVVLHLDGVPTPAVAALVLKDAGIPRDLPVAVDCYGLYPALARSGTLGASQPKAPAR